MQSMAHVGLALAVSLSSLLNFVLLHLFLTRKRRTRLLPAVSAVKTAVLSILIGWGAYMTGAWTPWCLFLIPVWVVVYIGMAFLLRQNEAQLFADMIKARIRRGKTSKGA